MAEQSPQLLVKRALEGERLAHAILVHGSNFQQVESFAVDLASTLLETQPIDDENAEDALARHPDAFFMRPSKKSRIITVDDMRELIRKIQHSPQQGERKVAFVIEVDRLHTSAANAFLKTLEEPPLNTTILLLTTKPHSILATIRSRCQLFRLPSEAAKFDDPRATEWLESYGDWLESLNSGGIGGKKTVPHFLIGLYALIERFSHVIEAMMKEHWKAQSKNLPENMNDEEKIAAESRISISIRQDFLAAIEVATESFARSEIARSTSAAAKLSSSVNALEDATSLLRLNMKAETMLESYLLRVLRIWTAS